MEDSDFASPGKPLRRYYKAALVEVFQPPNVHQRKLGRYVWVQGYSEHPDRRFPHYPASELKFLAKQGNWTLRLVRNPKPEDWQRP